jgi:hypothetical protein
VILGKYPRTLSDYKILSQASCKNQEQAPGPPAEEVPAIVFDEWDGVHKDSPNPGFFINRANVLMI